MHVFIAGAGNVGRSITSELLEKGHDVTIVDPNPSALRPDTMPQATWLVGDACEMETLERAHLDTFDAAIAATGDDQVNLVASLLAKTEFGVSRTVARVNHPKNEWMFDELWGVDVSVSTPRVMSALVEEAVSVGDVVRLFTFRHASVNLVAVTMPSGVPAVGRRLGDFGWPDGTILVAVIRDGQARPGLSDLPLEAGDEVLFLAEPDQEGRLRAVLLGEKPVAPEPEVVATGTTLPLVEEPIDLGDDDDTDDLPSDDEDDEDDDGLS